MKSFKGEGQLKKQDDSCYATQSAEKARIGGPLQVPGKAKGVRVGAKSRRFVERSDNQSYILASFSLTFWRA